MKSGTWHRVRHGAYVSGALWAELGLSEGAQVKVTQGEGSAVLSAVLDTSLPANVVRVPAGHPATAALGASFGTLRVDKV